MKPIGVLILAFTATILINESAADSKDWWKSAVFYQVYPRSFKDDDNDGLGDLKGITSKLDHFPESGIEAIWLSPIFKSPQKDNGYDISDYYDVDPIYGTLDDLQELIDTAHKKGVKVILDFVPNHTSDQHDWFIRSERNETGYEDFYIWADGKNSTSPPNNWISVFQNSSWTYSNIRKQYYLHQFLPAQPDLNYRSPHVIKAMQDVLKFWLDRHIDGFRIDAVPYLFEDAGMQDEPLSGNPDASNQDYEYLNHIYTKDQDDNYFLVYSWREFVDHYTEENGGEERVLMTEAYADINKTMYYFGTPDGSLRGAHFTFNFNFISYISEKFNATDVVEAANKWLKNIPDIYTSNWVLGNHDNHRVATRFGPDNADGFNMLMALLPGIGVTYNGEEIGQEDGEIFNSTDAVVRDYERTPFQWDNTTNAGFNNGSKTWLPVSEKYLQTNLLFEKEAIGLSHYKVYQILTKTLRKRKEFLEGSNEIKAINDDVVLVKRSISKSALVLLFNVADTNSTIDVSADLFEDNNILLTSTKSTHKIGDLVTSGKITLNAHESIVLLTKTK